MQADEQGVVCKGVQWSGSSSSERKKRGKIIHHLGLLESAPAAISCERRYIAHADILLAHF